MERLRVKECFCSFCVEERLAIYPKNNPDTLFNSRPLETRTYTRSLLTQTHTHTKHTLPSSQEELLPCQPERTQSDDFFSLFFLRDMNSISYCHGHQSQRLAGERRPSLFFLSFSFVLFTLIISLSHLSHYVY